MTLTIQNATLAGTTTDAAAVVQQPSPNHDGPIVPRFLIFHYTASTAASAQAQFLNASAPKPSSAHLLVHPDGAVTQLVPFNRRAWHAGVSRWGSLTDLNTHSIGVEVANWGYLLKSADGSFRSWTGTVVQPDQIVEAQHKNPQVPHRYWHAFTPNQLATCGELAELLVTSYQLEDVLGHDDVAPDRKQDPGPAFPLLSLRGRAVGRNTEVVSSELVYVGAAWLNVRSGPSSTYPLVANAVPAGLQLLVLERGSGWLRVRTPAGVEGWVCEPYTTARPLQSVPAFV